jgi:broad specificity phosphatase PhoE
MGTLYLVRHGQASFGADDYDNLSPLGHQQSQRLGDYFRERGLQFEAVLMGSLKRHRQTFEGIQAGLQAPNLSPLVWPGLNEYDSHAVIHTVHPQPLAKPNTPELYKHHFGLLRQGLQAALACVVSTTESAGVGTQDVEALAFAWLAWAHQHKVTAGNPKVTGARGARILGATWPA